MIKLIFKVIWKVITYLVAAAILGVIISAIFSPVAGVIVAALGVLGIVPKIKEEMMYTKQQKFLKYAK